MNYKLLFPSYRNRYLFIRRELQRWQPAARWREGLNLGTGEGDYDAMIAHHCQRLTACDINTEDVAFAARLNADVDNLRYQVADALALEFTDRQFDLVVSVDVLEHVGQPERMLQEISRVLAPGGMAFLSFPNLHFPVTYDPLNRLLGKPQQPVVRQGAYAFGHDYLIDPADLRQWAARYGLTVVEELPLSGYLAGLAEMYWTGVVQRWFKANATNLRRQSSSGRLVLRPSRSEPWLCWLTDALLWLDRRLGGLGHSSIGRGFVLRKPEAAAGS